MPDFIYEPISADVITRHITSKNYRNIFHSHDGYEVYLFLKGNVNFYFKNTCFHLNHGTLIAINPNEFHCAVSLDSHTPYERIYLNIKKDYVQRLSTPSTDLGSCFENNLDEMARITTLNEQTINEFIQLCHKVQSLEEADFYGSDVLRNTYVSQFLVLINHSFLTKSLETKEAVPNIMPAVLYDIIQYVEANLTKNITLQVLSEHLYLNGTYLSRRFKEYTGITLQQYIINKKITLAAAYLSEGKSVTEACYLTGFGNYSNFIRTFTKQMHVSPGKYRRSI